MSLNTKGTTENECQLCFKVQFSTDPQISVENKIPNMLVCNDAFNVQVDIVARMKKRYIVQP